MSSIISTATLSFSPPPSPIQPEAQLGVLELWASDTSAFFGEKIAVLEHGFTDFRLAFRVSHARAYRYFTLRMYDPEKRMRVDAMRLYGEKADGSAPEALPVCVAKQFVDVEMPIEATVEATVEAPVGDPPSPPPYIGTMIFRGGRRLDDAKAVDPVVAELHVLWKTALRFVDAAPTSFAAAYALLKTQLGSAADLPATMPTREELEALHATAAPVGDDAWNTSWWNRLEEHHDELADDLFALYPLRTPPGAHGRSPAASLITAMALTNASELGVPDAATAEARLINASCARLGGCEYHGYLLHASPLLDQAFQPYPTESRERDDGAWLAWLLSASIGPVVHLVSTRVLLCASDEACGDSCAACDGALASTRHAAVDVVRAVETELTGGGATTTDVVECVASLECVALVAEGVAARLGTVAFHDARLANVTAANDALWTYAADENARNESFADRRAGRAAATAAHRDAVGALAAPAWVRAHVVHQGRRLAEHRAEALSGDFGDNETRFEAWHASLDPQQKLLHATSSTSTAILLNNGSHDALAASHMQFLRAWASAGPHVGEQPNRTGVCADPHFHNRTVGCRVHAALMARALTVLRREEREAAAARSSGGRRRMQATNEQVIKDSIHEHLSRTCCAEFSDGRVECAAKYCEHHVKQETAKRMGRMLRRLSDAGDPRAAKIGPDVHAIVENMIAPELHSDPMCRSINESSLYFGGPTRMECVGRSLLKHASKKYGLDSETITKKMTQFGFSTGKTVEQINDAMGVFREISTSGNFMGGRRKLRAAAAKRASELLRGAERGGHGRRMQEGPRARAAAARKRRLDDEESALSDEDLARKRAATRGTATPRETHGFAHAARTIKERRAVMANASDTIGHHFKRIDRTLHHERLRRLAAGRAGGTRQDSTPRAESFHRDNLRQHAINPLLAFEVLQADEGSMSARFSGGVRRLADVARRWSEVNFQAQLAGVQRERRRRLSEDSEQKRRLAAAYDELERRQRERVGRRLSTGEAAERPVPDLDGNHKLAFLHDLVDWRAAADEWTRMHDLLAQRNEMRMQGRSVHEIVDNTKTGYKLLDDVDRFGFSKVGDALRRIWYRKNNGSDAVFVNHTRSHHDHAGRHSPMRHGRARRLDGFLGPAVAAPFALWDSTLYAGRDPAVGVDESKSNLFTAVIRYFVYGLGCYLTPPKESTVSSAITDPGDPSIGSDGERLKTLRPDPIRLCFPAIPVLVPTMPSFRQWTQSEGVDFSSLTYENNCVEGSWQGRARDWIESTLGIEVLSSTGEWLGLGGILRGAEGVDSIDSFVQSTNAPTGKQRVGHLVCGIVELGGLLYSVLILITLVISLPLVSVFSFLCIWIFDACVLIGAAARTDNRSAALRVAIQTQRQGLRRKKPSAAPSEKKPPLLKRQNAAGSLKDAAKGDGRGRVFSRQTKKATDEPAPARKRRSAITSDPRKAAEDKSAEKTDKKVEKTAEKKTSVTVSTTSQRAPVGVFADLKERLFGSSADFSPVNTSDDDDTRYVNRV